jgi:hypothetical protein
MSLLNWIFDIYQHSQIENLREDTARARAEAAAIRSDRGTVDAARLERALGELALATKTLQRMLVEKGVCTAGEFQAKVDEVDMEDGRRDGQLPLR